MIYRPHRKPPRSTPPSAFDHAVAERTTSSGLLTEIVNHETLGGFFATFIANRLGPGPRRIGPLKCTLFGAIVAIVCCYKGMTVSGGAAGVGPGVNDAVVISLLGVGALNFVFTQTLLATNPQLQTLR